MNQKGFAHILLILIIGIIAVGGAYYLGTKNSSGLMSEFSPIPSPSPSTTSPSLNKGIVDFQEYLTTNCGANYTGLISLDKVPLEIDLGIVEATESRITEQGGLICSGWYGEDPKAVFLPYGRFDSPNSYAIYDDAARSTTLEGGYFGFGSLKQEIQNDGEYIVSIDFSWPHGGPSAIGSLSVVGIVEKVVPYNDGNLYVNTSETFIEGDDPRLVNILSKYEDETQSEEWDVQVFDTSKKEAAYNEVIQKFFRVENASTKEWQIINQLKAQMEGFSAKN